MTVVLDAFSVGRTNSLSSSSNPLPFESSVATDGSNFKYFSSNQSGYLYSSVPSIYWMHVAVDVPAHTQAHLYISGLHQPFAIVRNHTSLPQGDTISRDGIVSVPAGQPVSMASDYPTETTGIMQPYWAGFRLDNYFNPLIAVSVACTTPIYGSEGLEQPVIYDLVLINIGSAWNLANNKFTAPTGGIYVISFSAGVMRLADSKSIIVRLLVNDIVRQAMEGGVNRMMTQDNTVDFISRSFFLRLNHGDNVTTRLLESTAYSDTINLPIALHIVLYNPNCSPQVGIQSFYTYTKLLGRVIFIVFPKLFIDVIEIKNAVNT